MCFFRVKGVEKNAEMVEYAMRVCVIVSHLMWDHIASLVLSSRREYKFEILNILEAEGVCHMCDGLLGWIGYRAELVLLQEVQGGSGEEIGSG